MKCLRGFRGGVSQMSMFIYKGERGVKNALNSVYVAWFVHSPILLVGMYVWEVLDFSFQYMINNCGEIFLKFCYILVFLKL